MKTLLFCNTNYQIIVAMQIALSFDSNYSIIITNKIKNFEEISYNLSSINIFESVSVVDINNISSLSLIRKCVFGELPEAIKNTTFDEFVCFNMDIACHIAFAYCYEKNNNIVINKMEEGLLSINAQNSSCRVLEYSYMVRRLLGKKNLKDDIRGFYCFSPAVNTSGIRSIQIPPISRDSLIVRHLKDVFCKSITYDYKEKYIFLSCIYDIEGGEPIGEIELAMQISTKVGKENMLIKVHPRDDVKRYIDKGFKVDENSIVPFEVLQLCNDFSEKILITTLSGSVLNINSLCADPPQSYYAYKLCRLDNNKLATQFRSIVEDYLGNEKLGLKNITILEKIEDL